MGSYFIGRTFQDQFLTFELWFKTLADVVAENGLMTGKDKTLIAL